MINQKLQTVLSYKELGKIIPVDTFGNPIADAEPVHYANDPQRCYASY